MRLTTARRRSNQPQPEASYSTARDAPFVKHERAPGFQEIRAARPIAEGTVLFTYDEWIADEVLGWERLTVADVDALSEAERRMYLRYAYDLDFGLMIGTFDWGRARHVSNFMNHSCEPTMSYGTADDIIAARDIRAGEELTIDYGNFIVNVDQDFECSCGSPSCRHQVRRDDWLGLIPSLGLRFPRFMQAAVRSRLDLADYADGRRDPPSDLRLQIGGRRPAARSPRP